MILYPLNSPPARRLDTVPAWEAIERKQKQVASEWWLVAQPDHAALAGDLAAAISVPEIPALDAEVLQAISLHDQGWAPFDAENPDHGTSQRPLSFFEVDPAKILLAWSGSIEVAELTSPIAGILVSEHFCRIGRASLPSLGKTRPGSETAGRFLEGEAERQMRLFPKQHYSAEEVNLLVDVLQFCDLISLYLCCGCQEPVEFPQRFNGRAFRARREGELCRIEPALFGAGLSLGVSARKHPSKPPTDVGNISLLLG
jgi:hypothetical protein